MKSDMTQPLNQPPAQDIEREIEKEYIRLFEIGKQLKETIAQTLNENVVNSNKSLEKIIKSTVKDLKDLIETYLQDCVDSCDWIEPDEHLRYLTALNADLKIYTMLTGDEAVQIRQKLSELEDEVYKTINLLYILIVSKKSGRLKTIEEIINSNVKVYATRAINNINTLFCKLENVKSENEVIKMLLSRVIEEAKKFKEELEKIKNEKVEIKDVNDIVSFMKKVNKLLEQGELAAIWTELIYEEDEKFYEELNIQYLIDRSYKSLMSVIEALRGEEIGWFEEKNEKRSKTT
ncbi:MAG: hypothetical protein QXH07_05920 [Thermoplasmata archaeon]